MSPRLPYEHDSLLIQALGGRAALRQRFAVGPKCNRALHRAAARRARQDASTDALLLASISEHCTYVAPRLVDSRGRVHLAAGDGVAHHVRERLSVALTEW